MTNALVPATSRATNIRAWRGYCIIAGTRGERTGEEGSKAAAAYLCREIAGDPRCVSGWEASK